jgi:hypothetical protein
MTFTAIDRRNDCRDKCSIVLESVLLPFFRLMAIYAAYPGFEMTGSIPMLNQGGVAFLVTNNTISGARRDRHH